MKEPVYFYRAHLQSGISLFFQVPGSLSETGPWKQTELQVGLVKCRAGNEERLLRLERVQLLLQTTTKHICSILLVRNIIIKCKVKMLSLCPHSHLCPYLYCMSWHILCSVCFLYFLYILPFLQDHLISQGASSLLSFLLSAFPLTPIPISSLC